MRRELDVWLLARASAQLRVTLAPEGCRPTIRAGACAPLRADVRRIQRGARPSTHDNRCAPDNQEPPMAETKTKPTGASVEAYLASRATPAQLADCKAIMAMCKRVTKQKPKMWGPSIVGYGSYTYRYETGHSGDACIAGFAVRGRELVVYLLAESPGQVKLLSKLGKHKMGKSCLYFKRLADLDPKVLEALIARSVADVKRRYPQRRGAEPARPRRPAAAGRPRVA